MYFSRTFKALNFDFQIQGLSRTFKVRANPVSDNPADILLTFHCILEDHTETVLSKSRNKD